MDQTGSDMIRHDQTCSDTIKLDLKYDCPAVFPAVLPGSLARQSCPAVLPCSLARQSFQLGQTCLDLFRLVYTCLEFVWLYPAFKTCGQFKTD
jgi:hypothetical protein